MFLQRRKKILIGFLVIFVLGTTANLLAQDPRVAGVEDFKNILPERDRAKVINDWLKWRMVGGLNLNIIFIN